ARSGMKKSRVDIGSIRREEIVEAAVSVIAHKGFQKLSLSEIEKKAGMSRGQLTYYFKTKESILLAVFDRLLQLMYQRIGTPGNHPDSGWEWVRHLLEKLPGQCRWGRSSTASSTPSCRRSATPRTSAHPSPRLP